MNVPTISADELAALWSQDKAPQLIDVRTPAEFSEAHLEFARNVPLDQLDPSSLTRSDAASRPLYVICRSGGRAHKACEKLISAGLNAVTVERGMQDCQHAGLPIVRGRKAISLERQVRIAAGALVVLGVGLGWLVHPGLLAISAFVGAGLVFAGITDTCGMAMLLAKLPWNRRTCCTSTQGSGCQARS
jgi:rhodanese-related sulfurtransferase